MSQKASADGVGAAARGSSSTGVGAAAGGSSSTAAGSSSADRGLVANVFGGQRGHEGYASSQEDLFKKIDKVVYPGHGDPDTMQDPKSTSERFAQCAVGTPVASGFTRVSRMRKVSGVKREYDCLQEYQCVTCQRNLASNLALRPPTENMRVFVPGPQLPASASKSTCEAVFREEHAEQLKRAGYLQLDVRFHAPDMELQGFDPLQTSSPGRKRPARESVAAAPQNTRPLLEIHFVYLPLPLTLPSILFRETSLVSFTIFFTFLALSFFLFSPSSFSWPLLRLRRLTSPSRSTPAVSKLNDVVVPPAGHGLNEKILSSPR